ncbi:hypothetical protein [Desulfosoma caldarium]|uniref:Uncharacterized protein n=1 Tax=Desulfosoma caldarium TaxID=610254 RepID=A0A3N1UPT2_9BACT|nr:hypothetical protein [Desulfosoma caldarium]ROQ89901.1 hypothetical protein EDC27_3020 [Desulfosoma caldarium]
MERYKISRLIIASVFAISVVLGGMTFCPFSHAAQDGYLSDEEVRFGAAMLLLWAKPKVAEATWAISNAYQTEINVQPLLDYLAMPGAAFIPGLQSIYEANQGLVVQAAAVETVFGDDASEGMLDSLFAETLDPIVSYIDSMRKDPLTINTFDWDECKDDDDECFEYGIKEELADVCMTTLALFPAFESFQIAPESGGVLYGTSGTDVLVSRGDTSLHGGPGVDAFVVGWSGHMTIDDFSPEDKLIFPAEFFGDTLEEIVSKLTVAVDTPEGLYFEFFSDGLVKITLRNVHDIDAFQVIAY